MDFGSLIRKLKERDSDEPVRLSFAFAITQAIDLVEEQPLSHGIKLTFLALSVASELELEEKDLLSIFYGAIFHDLGIINIRKRLYFWDRNIYNFWQTHKEEGFVSFKKRVEFQLPPEKLDTWNMILEDTVDLIKRCINIYGVREETFTELSQFFSTRYMGKNLFSIVSTIINLAEKIVHLINNDKRRIETVLKWIEDQYQNYDYEVISTFHKLLKDEDFIELLFGGEIEAEIVGIKPPEAHDFILERDDVKDLFLLLEEIWFETGHPHARKVEKLLRDFSDSLYLSEHDREKLTIAAGVHDIGKLHIPPEILYSKKKLTRPQQRIVQRHPYYSEMILNKIYGMEEIAEISGKHHEFLDCSGYWRGICGDEIDFYTRALTIADIFEALTSPRPYRKAYSRSRAISVMEKEFREKIDMEIFSHFKKFVLKDL